MNTQEQQANQPQPTQSEVQKHFPVHQPKTAEEDWQQFVDRAKASTREEREESPRRKPVDLSKATPEQVSEWNESGKVTPKQEATAADAKTEAKPEATKEAQPQPQQPLTPQQRWQQSYERMLERAAESPHFEKIVERMQEPFFPLSQEGHARYQVLGYALSQVVNADDVLYFLCHPDNASVAMNMQNAPPHKIAQAVHTISAQLRFGGRAAAKRAEEPKPRAPKPPAEVGGRGAVMGDQAVAAAKNGDFRTFEAEMNSRAARSRR